MQVSVSTDDYDVTVEVTFGCKGNFFHPGDGDTVEFISGDGPDGEITSAETIPERVWDEICDGAVREAEKQLQYY